MVPGRGRGSLRPRTLPGSPTWWSWSQTQEPLVDRLCSQGDRGPGLCTSGGPGHSRPHPRYINSRPARHPVTDTRPDSGGVHWSVKESQHGVKGATSPPPVRPRVPSRSRHRGRRGPDLTPVPRLVGPGRQVRRVSRHPAPLGDLRAPVPAGPPRPRSLLRDSGAPRPTRGAVPLVSTVRRRTPEVPAPPPPQDGAGGGVRIFSANVADSGYPTPRRHARRAVLLEVPRLTADQPQTLGPEGRGEDSGVTTTDACVEVSNPRQHPGPRGGTPGAPAVVHTGPTPRLGAQWRAGRKVRVLLFRKVSETNNKGKRGGLPCRLSTRRALTVQTLNKPQSPHRRPRGRAPPGATTASTRDHKRGVKH